MVFNDALAGELEKGDYVDTGRGYRATGHPGTVHVLAQSRVIQKRR